MIVASSQRLIQKPQSGALVNQLASTDIIKKMMENFRQSLKSQRTILHVLLVYTRRMFGTSTEVVEVMFQAKTKELNMS